jgi:hypothetical protein
LIPELNGVVLDREGEQVVYSATKGGGGGPFGDEAPGRLRSAAATRMVMLTRMAHYRPLSEAVWLGTTWFGRALRRGVVSAQARVAPQLHAGRCFGGYGWYDLHAAM